MVDLKLQRRARLERALLDGAEMHKEIAGHLLGIGDAEPHTLAGHDAGVADLAAGFRVERRLVQNDRTALACLELVDLATIFHQGAHDAPGGFGLIAEEFGGAELLTQRKPDRFARRIAAPRPGRARL